MSPEASTGIDQNEAIGRRIARKRRRADLTQQELADLAYVSRSLIQQVETGKKPATPSLVAAIATALHLDPAELYGQPYRGATAHADRIHAGIAEIRRALSYIDSPPELEAPPRPLDTLAAEVETLRRLSLDARHVQVSARLPAALAELSVHAYERDQPRAWRLLNGTQAIAASLARRLGYNDLAAFGIERAATAAARSDDPNLSHLVQLSRALLMMTAGAWGPGLKLVRRAGDGMDRDTMEARVVYGALQLRAAVLSARAGNQSDAWEHYGQATDVAGSLPPRVPDFYALQFNGPNVGVHGVAVAVELGDFDEAIRRDEDLARQWRRSASGLPPERRAHHEIDMGRALVSAGKYSQALQRLARADKTAPQMTRYHPMAREVTQRLSDHYRRMPEPLRLLMSHMGMS
ncbi:helix-turn-helix domain-containing protein [Nonomuraea sp. NPDC047897]|uniref:helix-turn-helix domain-containing protein n=1 Tax=Nonomuraea sp. NPDC047897 TaxID=3364346 RepID=UPI0037164C2F